MGLQSVRQELEKWDYSLNYYEQGKINYSLMITRAEEV